MQQCQKANQLHKVQLCDPQLSKGFSHHAKIQTNLIIQFSFIDLFQRHG